jgi:hypothetical protein
MEIGSKSRIAGGVLTKESKKTKYFSVDGIDIALQHKMSH